MDEKTSTGKMIAAVGGALLIVSLFLKWAGADIPSGLGDAAGQLGSQLGGAAQQAFEQAQSEAEKAASANAFEMFGWLPFLYIAIGVLAIAPLALDLLDMEIELPFDISLVTLVGGLLTLGGMLMMLDSIGSTKIGGWIALAASIAITAGGLMQTVEDPDEGGAGAYVAAAVAPPPPAAPPAAARPPAAPPAAAPQAPAPQAPPPQAPPPRAPAPQAPPPQAPPPAAPQPPPTPPPGA